VRPAARKKSQIRGSLPWQRSRGAGNSAAGVSGPLAVGLVALATAACGSKTKDGVFDIVPADAPADEPTYLQDAACLVALDSPPLLPAIHVAIGTDIVWDSNPPSSGPHYPIWAAFQAYSAPVPRGYYVHDLEHGAIVFAYNCADGDADCADVAAALQAVSDALPDDPLCAATGQGVRVRTVITPDPLLDVPVAAAAWGYTYKAECVDLPSLTAFAMEHYGNGPEVLCAQGTTSF
jgi:hypothetical protein